MKNEILNKKTAQFKRNVMSAAVLLLLFQNSIQANPSGAVVVNGQVSIDSSVANLMTITNSPNAIINWQDFNISSNELTQFIQQNSQSAVLNRVIGGNPSEILGQLVSNGSVFLINPNGVVFGANSVVDTQSLIASTLNLSNEDFLSGNYHFVAGSNAGDIDNQGIIRAGVDGNVILIAPNIKNSGIISTEGGQITLAAGSELTLTNLDTPDIQFQIQSPDNKVLNIGQVLTEGGAINVFAGSITHSGELNANSVDVDKHGNIKLVALGEVNLTGQSLTTANHASARGGYIEITADTVSIKDESQIRADGQLGGGEILIGGDYQGKNPDIHNAITTTVDSEVKISANAIVDNDGGKVIIWSDDTTEMHGYIEAKGGENSGNGGFVEVSGKQHLLMDRLVDVTAKKGDAGKLLLDPGTVTIMSGNSGFVRGTLGMDTVGADFISNQLNLSDLEIKTSDVGDSGCGTICPTEEINVNAPIKWSSTNDLSLTAGNNIFLRESISNDGTGDLILKAGTTNFLQSDITLNGGTLNITGDSRWSSGVTLSGNVSNNDNMILINDPLPVGDDFNLTNGIFTNTKNSSLMAANKVTGSLNIAANSTLDFQNNNSHNININNSGNLTKSSSTGTTTFTGDVVNTGTIDVKTGTLEITSGSWTNSGTINTASGTQFALASTISNLTNNGSLSGFGTIKASTVINNGTLSPGASPGTLFISGDLILNASSLTQIELAGITSFDQIQVAGTASLGGTLKVSEINGYVPTGGDSFSLITCGVACFNSFANVLLPNSFYSLTVNTSDVLLKFSSVTIPALSLDFISDILQLIDEGNLSWLFSDGSDFWAWAAPETSYTLKQCNLRDNERGDNGTKHLQLPEDLMVELSY